MNSGLCFYGCGKTVWWGEDSKLKYDDSEMKVRHPYHPQGQQPTYKQSTSYTPKPLGTSAAARNAEIRETQKLKQDHEIKMMEAQTANTKLLADAIFALAVATNKNAEATHELSQSTRFVKEKK